MTEQKTQLTEVKVLIEQAIEIYKKAFKKFFYLQFAPLFALLPVALFGGLFAHAWNIKLQLPILIGLGLLVAVAAVFSLYYGILFSMAPYMLLRNLKSKSDWKKLIFEGKPFFWKFVGVSIRYGLWVLLGFLLLVIPGVIWLVQYYFAVMLVVFENRSSDAMSRSAELVKGYWGDVFVRMLIPMMISAAISMTGSALAEIPGTDPFQLLLYVVSLIIGPVYLIYTYLVYQDLVRVKGS